MEFQPKVFSLEEANALIPELETLLACLDGKKEACERLHDMLLMDELLREAEAVQGAATAASGHLEEEARRLDGSVVEIRREMEKIKALGCILRSLERGWIDFPGRLAGQAVYFCWRRGEKTIQFYSVDSKSSERLPLQRTVS